MLVTTPNLRARPPQGGHRARLGAERTLLRSNNNEQSSGLPHSEIGGSGPITGFPPLIAGYHVLHRLLLPRHPPNALIALDLIQKEPDVICSRRKQIPHDRQGLLRPLPSQSEPKALYVSRSGPKVRNILVSVLDLDSLMSCSLATAGPPPLGKTDMTLMCISLNDVKMRGGPLGVQQDDQTHATCA